MNITCVIYQNMHLNKFLFLFKLDKLITPPVPKRI